MRTIKFRAKDLITGKWVEGNFVHSMTDAFYILEFKKNKKEKISFVEVHPINPSTVCQFTGMLDKNGREIYEHDLLDDFPHTLEVVFKDGAFRVVEYDMQGNLFDNPSYDPLSRYINFSRPDRTIIGVVDNRFDNKLKRISV